MPTASSHAVYRPLSLPERARVAVNRWGYFIVDDVQALHFNRFRCPVDTSVVLTPVKRVEGDTWYLWGQCRKCDGHYPISTEPEKLNI
ncbi:MAG: hypothetical protein HYT72_00785 [Candidatus Aenigmarchaeota archaeon]|nr:hypothetical protein [Candidatus Aenigmarchaeota archaeon]